MKKLKFNLWQVEGITKLPTESLGTSFTEEATRILHSIGLPYEEAMSPDNTKSKKYSIDYFDLVRLVFTCMRQGAKIDSNRQNKK